MPAAQFLSMILFRRWGAGQQEKSCAKIRGPGGIDPLKVRILTMIRNNRENAALLQHIWSHSSIYMPRLSQRVSVHSRITHYHRVEVCIQSCLWSIYCSRWPGNGCFLDRGAASSLQNVGVFSVGLLQRVLPCLWNLDTAVWVQHVGCRLHAMLTPGVAWMLCCHQCLCVTQYTSAYLRIQQIIHSNFLKTYATNPSPPPNQQVYSVHILV